MEYDDIVEYAYIFAKSKDLNGNTIYRVVSLVTGFYDVSNDVFVCGNYKGYKHVLYSSNLGFALRKKVPFKDSVDYYDKMFVHNYSLMNNNSFVLADNEGVIQLMWVVGDELKQCNDIDLDNYMNNEGKKMSLRITRDYV